MQSSTAGRVTPAERRGHSACQGKLSQFVPRGLRLAVQLVEGESGITVFDHGRELSAVAVRVLRTGYIIYRVRGGVPGHNTAAVKILDYGQHVGLRSWVIGSRSSEAVIDG